MAAIKTLIDNGSEVIPFVGGTRTFAFYGNFGGGTLEVEVSFENSGIWIPLFEDAITQASIHTVQIFRSCELRFTLSGATSPNLIVSA
jgi:hypothetical protein